MSLCRYFVSVFLIFACQNLFYAYCNAKAEYSYNVDISKFANKSFKDAGVSARKDSINSRVEMFGGIDFKIVNPSENGGKSVLSLDCSADSGKKISIPLDNFTHEGAISVYFLCNAKIDGKSAGENVGEVKVVVYDNYGKPMKSGALKIGSQIGLVGGGVFDSCKKISNSDLLNGNLYLCSFNIIAPWKSGVIPSSISIVPSGNGVINIFGITLSTKFVDTLVYFDFRESEWKAVDTSNLLVREGSALDVSKFMTEKPAGKYGRVVVSKYGHFEFENKPGVRVKFKSTNWRPSWNFSDFLSSKEKIDAVVSRIRAQGYNMVRWRCTPERSFEYEADFKCKSDIIDKYDYFLYACGREGVYSHLMIVSHLLGEMDQKWGDRFDIKIKFLFGDSATRESWRKFAHEMLLHVNPYTGLAWKDDPSIATAECFNELDMIFTYHPLQGLSKGVMEYAENFVRGRLEKKYGSIESLNAAWKPEKPFASFAEIRPISNKSHFDMGAADFSEIILERSRNLREFCRKVVRDEIGFKAPMHQYNFNARAFITQASLEWGEYIAVNTYAAPQSGMMNVGGMCNQEEWISEKYFGNWFLFGALKRVAGMPFIVTEFQQRHWNPYKHEAGVFFPAYAAFQDFDALTVHDQAIGDKARTELSTFNVANSPVFRANEFLNFCLFYRGDVSPAKNRVEVRYGSNAVRREAVKIEYEQSKIAFMTGFSLSFPDSEKGALKNVPPARLSLEAGGYVEASSSGNVADSASGGLKTVSGDVKLLREKGILPESNISDPANGVFQSDTGEITMRLKEGLIKVCTPRTEAVVLKQLKQGERVGRLFVKSVSVPAAVAVCSVDGKSLASSSKMVLILNTDNISSDFKLSPKLKILYSKGKLPVRVRTCKLSAELSVDSGVKFDLYALDISGKRLEKLYLPIIDGIAKIEIDTAKLVKEPSVFFEIVRSAD